MTTFILNDCLVETDLPRGMVLLDFIRYQRGLPGTKIGCREGDCGACTVLEGVLTSSDKLHYRTIVSCLTPLGNVHGKHIVTVEGLNMDVLSPVQQAFVDHNGTQCGFCTPGFVISLTGHVIASDPGDVVSALASMDGNICRCTGYKSIERAAISVSKLLKGKDPANPMTWLVGNGFLPEYFAAIPDRLTAMHQAMALQHDHAHSSATDSLNVEQGPDGQNRSGHSRRKEANPGQVIMGGGTDLMVQQPEKMAEQDPWLVLDQHQLKGIRHINDHISIGASATASDIMNSPVMEKCFPEIRRYFRLVSSEPIRNMGTLAGNIVNASPIGDLSIIFLALDASLDIRPADAADHRDANHRTLALRDFFLGYKKLNLQAEELITSLSFRVPAAASHFNFEKVSKRTHLDIASVNTAISMHIDEERIISCHASCGGVAPVPLYLKKTSAFLSGQPLTVATVCEAESIVQQEIAPISDVRGGADYKRLLARQLFFAHFLKLFPDRFHLRSLTDKPGSA